MKVVIFGANGQFGTRFVNEGLARDHEVTAVVRNVSSITKSHDRLTVRTANVLAADEVAEVIRGQQAVLSGIGPGGPGVSDQFLDVLTTGMPNIISGMQAAGVKRLITMGSIATLQVAPGLLLRDTPDFPTFARNISGAHLEAAQALEASGLDWTIVCPPLTIETGAATGRYRVQRDFLIEGEGRITFEDAAHFVLNELEQGNFVHHRVNISY